MEKKIIRRCYGRKYQLVEVQKSKGTYCPTCAFDGQERFCTKVDELLTKRELAMSRICSKPAGLRTTMVWWDVTPAWQRLFNRIVGRA
jgi:hypothetical protein